MNTGSKGYYVLRAIVTRTDSRITYIVSKIELLVGWISSSFVSERLWTLAVTRFNSVELQFLIKLL